MSWFMEISEKAENILNSIDKNAAIALSKQKSTKITNQNDTFHSPLPENSAIISLEEHFAPETKPNKDVFLSFTDETPASKIEKAEPSISYQRPIPPKVNDKSNDQFQTEILQNEIHSLNNEISLLLNRAKIAEQKSISLAEKLATVERKNLQLEDELSKLNVNGNTERNEDTSKSSVELEPSETNKKTSKSEWHEHYESQIQELLQEKTNLEETVKSKDDEIIMLKSRLNQQSFSFSSDDLSSRLRAMTITLVQKQSSLERVTLEKTSLEAKYDQLQKKYEEVVHMLHQRLNANDTDDVKAQIPVLKTEKGLRHRIRNAYSSFNPTSLNIELLLKKSSLVKTFVWIYLILMHCLVFLLLNSHMPDTTSNL